MYSSGNVTEENEKAVSVLKLSISIWPERLHKRQKKVR